MNAPPLLQFGIERLSIEVDRLVRVGNDESWFHRCDLHTFDVLTL